MPSMIKCLSCGATFSDAVGPCTQCGGSIEVSVSLTGVEAKCIAGQVGTVADSPIPGGKEIKYTAPTGSQSETLLVGNQLNTHVTRPIDVGRPGEDRVMACIRACLAKAGTEATTSPANDQAGEDGVLLIRSGKRVPVQIVTASPNDTFWGNVARESGGAVSQANLSEAAEWIHTAIKNKAEKYSNVHKSEMLLAVDVVHIGVLTDSALFKQYRETNGDPSARFDFGAVWLIGPTENHVLSLGNSQRFDCLLKGS